MPVQETFYPYRQALKVYLRHEIATNGVPAMNASLARISGANPVAFSDASIVRGDLLNVTQPTMCICSGAEETRFLTNDAFLYSMSTQIRVKTPVAGDNFPEDFDSLFDIVVDTMRDLLTSQRNWTFTPVNPSNSALILPAGAKFQNAYFAGAIPLSFPVTNADGVTRCRGILITHVAEILSPSPSYRASPIGG